MMFLKFVLVIGIITIFYSYIGYGVFIWAINKINKLWKSSPVYYNDEELPEVSLVIAAYNEEKIIKEKIENSCALDYPENKLKIIVITDGSTDGTNIQAQINERIQVLHHSERKGKIDAIHRAMNFVTTPIVIFSDANTSLNKESIKNIARHYFNPEVGGVAGEKKIYIAQDAKGVGAGEGLYWKYESWLKKNDSDLYSVVGAAGELFSIRTEHYEYVGKDILLDDFLISLKVCQKGYRVIYEPDAYAIEAPSSSMAEEQKRKIRISAGAFQSILLLKDLLNIFKYPLLSFQYISHRILRWTLCPIFLPLILVANFILLFDAPEQYIIILFLCQLLFYISALVGYVFSVKNIKVKALYIPYYFVFINLSLYLGFLRFMKGSQTVLWEKAARENLAR